jgi:hypothetical protein
MRYIEELEQSIQKVLENVKISQDEEINTRVISLLIKNIIEHIKGFVRIFEIRAYKKGYQDCLENVILNVNNVDTDLKNKVQKIKFDSEKI